MESIREIFIPKKNKIELTIPDKFIGQKVEVFAFVEEKKDIPKVQKKKTFDAIKLDLTGFKFNREEANER
ncbi:MAG TPA: hypothetical protein VIJ95_01985 [Hanamia sp.]